MKHLAKNVVVVLSLLALGAFGTWIALRPRLPRGDGFTDGEQFLAATRTRDELRLARWEEPRPLLQLAQLAQTSGADAASTTDPFVDPATGRIFFVKGEPGAEDLWLATPEGDRYVVRPISELNSPRRETAPCFADGWLWFASDRAGGQGGLDLWRAPISGDRFLSPENLGATVNSPSDETDPAVRTPTEIWFASNRETAGNLGGGDFDLFLTKSDGVRFSAPEAAGAVGSPFDERAPAFSPDGRVLIFASNRSDGRGGFDLWRSLLRDGEFQKPANLGTPNSASDELGATLTDDGFTLLYASDRDEPGRFALLQTRTRELFPIEAPRFTLADFTVLLLLALIALLAWLARRWEALDILYKCMVVSLLVHLMILWATRRVDVEAKAADFAGTTDTFEVHVLGDVLATVARMEDRARGESVDSGSSGSDFTDSVERAAVLPQFSEDVGPSSGGATIDLGARSELAEGGAAPAAAPRTLERGEFALAGGGGDPVHGLSETIEPMGAAAPAIALNAKPADATSTSGGGHGAGVVAAAASFSRLSGMGGASGEEGTGPGVAHEAAGARVDRAGAGGEGGAGVAGPGAMTRDRLPATRARGGHDEPVVATSLPSDRVESAAAQGGGNGTPASLAVSPTAFAGGDPNGTNGTGTGGGAAAGSGGGGNGLAGPRHAELPVGAPIAETGPRQEGPLAGGSKSGRGGTNGTGDGNGSGDGSGDGTNALLLGASRALGPSEPRGGTELPAIAMATPKDGVLGGAGGEGSGTGGGKPGPGPSDRAPGSGGAGEGGTPEGTSSSGTPGLVLAPLAGLGGAGRGAGGVVAASGPARASLLHGTATADFGPGTPGPSPIGRIDLPIAGTEKEGEPAAASAPGHVSKLYERRFGEEKKVAVREGGGSEETERAVLAGLRYLAKVQRPKGFFGDNDDVDPSSKYRDFRVGKTALATLAFMGAGHTHRSDTEFSGNVLRALSWIVSKQDAETGHFGNSEAYSHGIATYALAECYAITKDEMLREPLEKALAHLLAMQQRGTNDPRKEGGWTYYYVEGPGFDEFPRASISAWQVMALESAKVGGLPVPDDALAAARNYFLKSFDPSFGGFRYTHNPSWLSGGYGTLPASTPASMFALTLLGEKDHSRVAAAEEYVLDRLPQGYRFRGEDAFVRRGQCNVYFWYYSTLALFCRGGQPWRDWNDALKQTLLPAQARDGSWEALDVYAQRYAHDSGNERSYTTSMCVLMLEVYYRYFTPLLGKFEAQ
jgi:hypothetical protein